jgi:hypothetical protein
MRNVPRHVETIRTVDTHMKDDPCGLQSDDHKIAARFHRVLISARDALDNDVKIIAGGCNTCTTYDIEDSAYIYYVAQTDGIDRLSVGYGICSDGGVTPKEIARALVAAAERLDVDVSWNGDTTKKVYLGDDTFYEDEYGSLLES